MALDQILYSLFLRFMWILYYYRDINKQWYIILNYPNIILLCLKAPNIPIIDSGLLILSYRLFFCDPIFSWIFKLCYCPPSTVNIFKVNKNKTSRVICFLFWILAQVLMNLLYLENSPNRSSDATSRADPQER